MRSAVAASAPVSGASGSTRLQLGQHLHSTPHSTFGPLSLNMLGRAIPSSAAGPPCGGSGGVGLSRRCRVVAADVAAGRSAAEAAEVELAAAPAGPEAPAAVETTELVDSGRRTYTAAEVFQCAEESLFYSQALEKLLPLAASRHAERGGLTAPAGASAAPPAAAADASAGSPPPQPPSQGGSLRVVEFGTGDGTPVISALTKCRFPGAVHGFELNPTAAALAREHAAAYGLGEQYQIHNCCFYAGTSSPDSPAAGSHCLISNPPYLPAPDADILMPELFGGVDGAALTRDLLSLRFPYAMLLVASYSNPAAVLRHAAACGYRVVDFLVTPLSFGTYSSQPKVRNWITAMHSRGEAFYSGGTYLLAGVLFERADLPPRKTAAAAPQPSSNGHSNGNGHHADGNGHSNGNGHNGNGGGAAGLTVYHEVEAAPAAAEDDISPQLLRLLTAL